MKKSEHIRGALVNWREAGSALDQHDYSRACYVLHNVISNLLFALGDASGPIGQEEHLKMLLAEAEAEEAREREVEAAARVSLTFGEGRSSAALTDQCGEKSPGKADCWCAKDPGHGGPCGDGSYWRKVAIIEAPRKGAEGHSIVVSTPPRSGKTGVNRHMIDAIREGRLVTNERAMAMIPWAPSRESSPATTEPAADAEKVNRELGRIGAMLSALTPCCKKQPLFRESKRGVDVFECVCRLVYTSAQLERVETPKVRIPDGTELCCRAHAPAAATVMEQWDRLQERCS